MGLASCVLLLTACLLAAAAVSAPIALADAAASAAAAACMSLQAKAISFMPSLHRRMHAAISSQASALLCGIL